MASLWDKYDSDKTYDEYLGEDNKLRKQAKVISNTVSYTHLRAHETP